MNSHHRESAHRPPACWVLCVGLVALLLAAPAAAQTGQGQKLAEMYNEEGNKQFKLGNFSEAAKLYAKAYDTSSTAKYLYNLGLCHLKLGTLEHLRKAEINFRAVRKEAVQPGLKERADRQLEKVKAVMEKLRRERLEAEARARAASEQRAKDRPRPADKPRTAPPKKRPSVEASLRPESLKEQQPPSTEERSRPIYKKWWFWTIVGAAVVGGGVAAGVVVGTRDTRVPTGPVVDYSSLQLRGRP